jgi:hypothetical protein
MTIDEVLDRVCSTNPHRIGFQQATADDLAEVDALLRTYMGHDLKRYITAAQALAWDAAIARVRQEYGR